MDPRRPSVVGAWLTDRRVSAQQHPRLYGMFPETIAPLGSAIEVPVDAQAWFSASVAVVLQRRIARFTSIDELTPEDYQLRSGLMVFEPSWYSERNGVNSPTRVVGSAIASWAMLGQEAIEVEESEVQVRAHLNGKPVAEWKLADVGPSPCELLAYLSRYLTSEPGDVLFLGCLTPPQNGVALQVGDSVSAEVGNRPELNCPVSVLDLSSLQLSESAPVSAV